MAFELKPIYKLYPLTFTLPSYQRGYRWDYDQVNELLDDLKAFVERSSPKDSDYYCLQPIVVSHVSDDTLNYILIDGQQRLTTLYLLHKYLNEKEDEPELPYSFIFEKRKEQEDFINNDRFIPNNDTSGEFEKNIDNFYMRKAYENICAWFSKLKKTDPHKAKSIKDGIQLLLLTCPNEDKPTIKIIWYELDTHTDNPNRAFDRLNYGRIRLTGTELVKALLLCSDNRNDKDAIRRSHGWDRMEKSLQEPLFWSMLELSNPKSSKKDEALSHIELILNIVADEINEELPKESKRAREKDENKYNYNVVDSYFRLRIKDGLKRDDIVKEIWERIENTFNQVRNWYDNPLWYHYIGLWRRLRGSDIIPALKRLSGEYKNKTKQEFSDALLNKISTLLRKYDLRSDEEKNSKKHILEASELSYETSNGKNAISSFLLVFNVMTLADSSLSEEHRFPFHLYDKYEEKSLEHIHPQNITFELSPEEVKEWCLTRASEIDEIASSLPAEDLKQAKEAKEKLHEIFESKEWEKPKARFSGEDDQLWTDIKKYVSDIDKCFGDLANISQNELHSIKNMALVDQPTNSALSNRYLDKKRTILQQRNKNRLDFERTTTRQTTDDRCQDGMYLMPATEHVFSKYYTVCSNKPVGDMRFWRPEDRDAYMNAIKKTIDHFIKD